MEITVNKNYNKKSIKNYKTKLYLNKKIENEKKKQKIKDVF